MDYRTNFKLENEGKIDKQNQGFGFVFLWVNNQSCFSLKK